MALRGASTTTDTDWLDWSELAKENAAVVCSVREIEPESDFGNGPVRAVRARVIVLTGSQAGAIYPNERILKAGIRSKLTTVGDDVVGRVAPYGTRKPQAIGLESEESGDIALAEAALAKAAKGAGGNGKVPNQRAAAVEEDDDLPPF
jgi:hypothetical protein